MTERASRYLKTIILMIISLVAGFISPVTIWAYQPRMHCAEDTAIISGIINKTVEHGGTLGERIRFAAEQLTDIPGATSSDNDTIGTIMLNMHWLDRLPFLNTVIAIAEASRSKLPRVEEFIANYENISRRKGQDNGFISQLLYISDWIVDNVYRGNLKELTENMTGSTFKTKTLDYVTHHPEEYPALEIGDNKERMKMIEMGYRGHKIPHLKKQTASNKELQEMMRDGDIIVMLSPLPDYDLYDVGVVAFENGEPYLIHISHQSGKVEKDPYPLPRLFKIDGQNFYGFRWLRVEE